MSRLNEYGMWLGVFAALLGAASMDGFDVVDGGLLVVVLVLSYLAVREMFSADRDS